MRTRKLRERNQRVIVSTLASLAQVERLSPSEAPATRSSRPSRTLCLSSHVQAACHSFVFSCLPSSSAAELLGKFIIITAKFPLGGGTWKRLKETRR